MDKTEESEPSTSANPVLELELTEEKLPMTLSRQEVSQSVYGVIYLLPSSTFSFACGSLNLVHCSICAGNSTPQRTRGTDPIVWRI